jgi:hypothetical protein
VPFQPGLPRTRRRYELATETRSPLQGFAIRCHKWRENGLKPLPDNLLGASDRAEVATQRIGVGGIEEVHTVLDRRIHDRDAGRSVTLQAEHDVRFPYDLPRRTLGIRHASCFSKEAPQAFWPILCTRPSRFRGQQTWSPISISSITTRISNRTVGSLIGHAIFKLAPLGVPDRWRGSGNDFAPGPLQGVTFL